MEENLSTDQKINLSNAHTLTSNIDVKVPYVKKNENAEENFLAYAYSRLGRDCKANNDNFYCNGSYMKHFKYEDFKKSDISENDMGIFAVCCDESDNDEGCKIIFKCLAGIQEAIYNCGSIGKIKKLLRWYLEEANRIVLEDEAKNNKQYSISLSLAVLFENTVVYVSCGNSIIVSYNGKNTVKMLKRTSNDFIGKGNPKLKIFTDFYTADSRFAFCTKGIITKMSMEDIAVPCELDEPKDIAVNIVKTAMDMKTENNATCLVVKSRSKQKLKLSSIVIMVLCSVVVCFDIAVLIRLLIG